jgi:hypothetical protein
VTKQAAQSGPGVRGDDAMVHQNGAARTIHGLVRVNGAQDRLA